MDGVCLDEDWPFSGCTNGRGHQNCSYWDKRTSLSLFASSSQSPFWGHP